MIPRVVGYSSSSWYEKPSPITSKREVNSKHSDDEVLSGIKEIIQNESFSTEGYKKVTYRLCKLENPIKAAKARVNRLMRENGLLSSFRIEKRVSKREHKGKISTIDFNQMWATDGKEFWVEGEGWHWFFGVIEHCNSEILSFHVAKKGSRFAALEPIKEAIRKQFGTIDKDVYKKIKFLLRSDHGSQYTSNDFVNQMNYWA